MSDLKKGCGQRETDSESCPQCNACYEVFCGEGQSMRCSKCNFDSEEPCPLCRPDDNDLYQKYGLDWEKHAKPVCVLCDGDGYTQKTTTEFAGNQKRQLIIGPRVPCSCQEEKKKT